MAVSGGRPNGAQRLLAVRLPIGTLQPLVIANLPVRHREGFCTPPAPGTLHDC